MCHQDILKMTAQCPSHGARTWPSLMSGCTEWLEIAPLLTCTVHVQEIGAPAAISFNFRSFVNSYRYTYTYDYTCIYIYIFIHSTYNLIYIYIHMRQYRYLDIEIDMIALTQILCIFFYYVHYCEWIDILLLVPVVFHIFFSPQDRMTCLTTFTQMSVSDYSMRLKFISSFGLSKVT